MQDPLCTAHKLSCYIIVHMLEIVRIILEINPISPISTYGIVWLKSLKYIKSLYIQLSFAKKLENIFLRVWFVLRKGIKNVGSWKLIEYKELA